MRFLSVLTASIVSSWFSLGVLAATRTEPPAGAVVVRQDAGSGEFSTINEALNSLDDSSDASIFIYPGTYEEQVYITRSGPLTVRVISPKS